MTLASFLTSAVGGSLFGWVGNIITGYVDVLRKGKEAEIQIKLMEAQSASAEKVAGWDAFKASQLQDSTFTVPAGTWPWAASLFVLVEAFRRFTRPALTWALFFITASAYQRLPVPEQVKQFDTVTFASFSALFWWFGERYSKKK